MSSTQEQDKRYSEFIKTYGVACGGNWTAMLLSAIKNGMPDVYAKMESRNYEFVELLKIIETELENRKRGE